MHTLKNLVFFLLFVKNYTTLIFCSKDVKQWDMLLWHTAFSYHFYLKCIYTFYMWSSLGCRCFAAKTFWWKTSTALKRLTLWHAQLEAPNSSSLYLLNIRCKVYFLLWAVVESEKNQGGRLELTLYHLLKCFLEAYNCQWIASYDWSSPNVHISY